MRRSLAFFSTLPLLALAAQAQCLGPVTGTAIPLTPTTGFYPADDEGISAAVPLGFVFPMAGTLGGGLDHAFVSSNGEIYLTNASYGLGAPVGGVPLYGFDTLAEMRGTAGANPRVCGFAADHEAGSGMTWGIFVDTTVANEATFRFHDMTDFGGSLSCDWSVKLLATGAMEFSYGTSMPNGTSSFVGNIAGVSIGNAVGTGTDPEVDLTSTQDSGTLGLLYEAWPNAVANDLNLKSILIVPNGLGGFISTVNCSGAFHEEYGAGCYNAPSGSVYQHFATAALASPALTGNALSLTNVGGAYVANWLPGVAATMYVVPSGTAIALPANNDGSHTIAPSVPLTVPGGSSANVTINHNGIITAGAVSNNDFDWTPTGTELSVAADRAFYSWHDYADFEVGSGLIKYEEANVGGNQILYVTWDNVDMYPIGTPQLNTLQFQMNLTTGDVVILWTVIDPDSTSPDGSAHLVGYTAPGVAPDPGSQDLSTTLPAIVGEELLPLTLSASPAPTFTVGGPSVPITYQVDNLRDLSPFVPGFYLATLVFSFNGPIVPGGIDLTFVGVDAPGCNLLVGTLDVLYNISPTSSSHGEVIVVPQPLSPGTTFYVQAANFLIPNSLPNGLNNFGIIVSNGVKSKFDLF